MRTTALMLAMLTALAAWVVVAGFGTVARAAGSPSVPPPAAAIEESREAEPLSDESLEALEAAEVPVERPHLLLSEFMADNDVALYDDDCDRSDWIEIHNAGDGPADLAGWALTDNAADLAKWRFPAYRLEPGAYLVVFASQKNKTNLPPRACRTRANSLAGFHTNFKLDAGGEYLALVAPDGEVVSAFAPRYPPQRRDVSYGRPPGAVPGAGAEGYFSRPTPRAANTSTGDGFAPDVWFSRPSGTFLDPFSLALSCAASNAVLRYTVDGTFPAETNVNLRTYSGPLTIGTTMQVRARAFVPGLLPGPPSSETFLRLTNSAAHLASFTSTLPLVVITTLKSATIGGSVNTPVHFSVFEPRDGRATLMERPTFTTRGAAKTRGSSTGGQPQSNLGIEWWDEFNQDRDLPVLGMPEDSEWVLYAPNEYDAALIHNPFTMELSRQMNFAAPRTRFVEVYLNKGGLIRSNDWFGLYVLMEKPGLSRYRIDAPKAAPEDVEAPEVTGSYLFKTDRLDPGDTGFSAGGAVNAYVEPKEREMKSPQRAPQLAYLAKYFRDLDTALRSTNPDLRDPVRGYRGYLELTNWIDFHVLETLSGQVDAIRLSTYFYKRREGKLEYGPRWDYDRAWESKADGRDDNPRIWNTGGGLFGAPWWNRVLADRDAWQLWIDRWSGFRSGVLSQTNMFRWIDQMTNEISVAQPRENRRWTATAPRVNYPNEIRLMKTWISNRLAWIDGQFASPPRMSSGDARVSVGQLLSLEVPASISHPTNVAIYYTLDGTDPRPPGGTSPPVALRYTGPIPIEHNSRVVARLRDLGRVQRGGVLASSPWSAPVAATLVVSPAVLVLSEVMFHPEAPPVGSSYTRGDFEFLELLNASASTVELAGCRFSAGIEFRFPTGPVPERLHPGERLLLVRNRAAFLSRYPAAADRVAGEFTGSLADEGERLALEGPFGESLLDFRYHDDVDRATDGLGFSLVLVDETTVPGRLGEADRWRRSARPGGSPGTEDPTPDLSPPSVWINEILAAPLRGGEDWIELSNPGPEAVDLAGWWLTDTLEVPRKVPLPAGTRIGAGGFLRLAERVFGSAQPQGFGLGAGGDGVWLLSADASGELTGWVHGLAFGPADPGVALGRTTDGAGFELWAAQRQPTPGLANTGPRVGPLVLGEVAVARSALAQDLRVRDGFVELWNTGETPMGLTDPLDPDLGWHLRGDVSFDFAGDPWARRSITLEPGGRVVVVGFDPALDVDEAAAFRACHALDAAVMVLGPWRGAFDPARPFVRLLPPGGDADADLDDRPSASSEAIDEFRAQPGSPWPAGGLAAGASWVRQDSGRIGADGAAWRATRPTPGRGDADADGLPDEWEQASGLNPFAGLAEDGADGDPDGDGFSNLAEFRNGTDPRLGASRFRLRMFASGWGEVTGVFAAPPGTLATLESSVDPAGSDWNVVRSLTMSAEGTGMFRLQTRLGGARFYRVRLP